MTEMRTWTAEEAEAAIYDELIMAEGIQALTKRQILDSAHMVAFVLGISGPVTVVPGRLAFTYYAPITGEGFDGSTPLYRVVAPHAEPAQP